MSAQLIFTSGSATFGESSIPLSELLAEAAKTAPLVVHSSAATYTIGSEDICVLEPGTTQVVLPASKYEGYKIQIANYTGANLVISAQNTSTIYNVFYNPPQGNNTITLKPHSNIVMYYIGVQGATTKNWMTCIG